jgi:hypothetical protein
MGLTAGWGRRTAPAGAVRRVEGRPKVISFREAPATGRVYGDHL